MAQGKIHNESSGPVAGNNVQIGTVHGDVSMWPGSADPSRVDRRQAELVRVLAGEVHAASDKELSKWSIRDRDALPVRWNNAAEDLVDHWEKIHSSTERVSLTGHFTAVRDTYAAIESKRLVILGRAGSGKTVLAHRFILDLLGNVGSGETGPVPVLFSLGDWNPATDLSSWLAQHLIRDFPFLETRDSTTGKKQAEVFVDRGLVLPVLDGFDELHHERHRAAISQISNLDRPLIVTSRPGEYAQAARMVKPVSGTAAIALEALTLDDTHRYLRHSTTKRRATDWDAVFDHLRTAHDDIASQNVTTVLTTPLTIMLARTVYNETPNHQPDELLDIERFPTATALEDHLLGAYLDTVYDNHDTGPHKARRPNWGADQARHWLGHLATHLRDCNTHELTWWHLPTTLHRRTRILVTTITAGLAVVLAIQLISGFVNSLALLIALTSGLAGGLASGLINEMGFIRGSTGREPERLRLGLRRRYRPPRSWPTYRTKLLSELTSGLSIGFAIGLAFSAWSAPPGYSAAIIVMYGLIYGLAAGLANIIVSTLGNTHESHATTPWRLLARDRMVTLVRTITTAVFVVAIANGLEEGLVRLVPGGLHYGTYMVAIGPVAGTVAGIARMAVSAWGSWLLFARLWLPLKGRLPWRPKRFLEDAHDRGVLRRTGAVYQFRHAHLRDHLANQTRQRAH